MRNLNLPIVFILLLGLDYKFGHPLLHLVGWVFLLPNHNYLYVLAWVPPLVLLLSRLFATKIPFWAKGLCTGVVLIGGIAYFLAAGAQLWRLFVLPFGLITLAMGVGLISEARTLVLENQREGYRTAIYAAVAFIGTLVCSTIAYQPWYLVKSLPNVWAGNYAEIQLSSTRFNLTKFSYTDLSGADFSNAELTGVTFTGVTLDDADFTGANLDGVTFRYSSMKGVDFSGSRIYESRFSNVDLRDAIIEPGFTARTNIVNSLLCGASFEPSTGYIYGWDGSVIDDQTQPPEDRAGWSAASKQLTVVVKATCFDNE